MVMPQPITTIADVKQWLQVFMKLIIFTLVATVTQDWEHGDRLSASWFLLIATFHSGFTAGQSVPQLGFETLHDRLSAIGYPVLMVGRMHSIISLSIHWLNSDASGWGLNADWKSAVLRTESPGYVGNYCAELAQIIPVSSSNRP
jgi:hypothetical protein